MSEEVDSYDFRRSVLPVGTVLLGKYRIEGVIGSGGMAVVYAATHRNRKRFAVKMLHPELSNRGDIRARFVREGYLANSVEHSGVVSVLDDDVTEDGSAFLVMELLEGATVEAFAPRWRPLPLRESLSIAYDLLGVLEAAHAKGIVHRDIKPGNVFLTRQGQVKVLDFGIARLRDATLGAKTTGTGAMLGTPAFMAPEQALALPSEIDARTDLWAVGATLFTMLSGQLVHAGDNARQVMIRAATEPARSLASVAPELPRAVVDWVGQALVFDKSARWESAGAMRERAAEIQHQLFGPLEEGCAKRLFELCAPDLETARTELSPHGAPRSAVRGSRRTTLESFQANVSVGPTLLALPSDRISVPWRRAPLALIAVGAIALGLGLRFGLQRFAQPLEASLAAARPAIGVAPSVSYVPPDISEVYSAAARSIDAPALSATPSKGAATPVGSSDPINRSRKTGVATVQRARAPNAPVVSAPAISAPVVGAPLPAVAPSGQRAAPAAARNPLQIDLQ